MSLCKSAKNNTYRSIARMGRIARVRSEKVKIVVLDGETLNPGDLSWEGFEALGECVVYDRTPDDQVLERARDADVLYTNKTPLDDETIRRLPKLKFIGVLATGYNVVDIDAAKARGIPVSNIPTYGTNSVAQMAFAHILNFTQRVAHHSETVRQGRWSSCPDFCYWDFPLIELDGLTLGIIGFGRIGQATARLGRAFGMKILAFDVLSDLGKSGKVKFVSLDDIFSLSDFVSLHCPLTADNYHLVGADRLAQMKPTAYLINTSRGQLVDEGSLYRALKQGEIAGAGLDVLEREPPDADSPLYRLDNCFITPHISWATRSARARLMRTGVENLKAFLAGRPSNQVNH